MVKTIKWNERALRKMREIIDYLKHEISEKVADDFIEDVYFQISRLKEHPEIGRPVVTTRQLDLFVLVNIAEFIVDSKVLQFILLISLTHAKTLINVHISRLY